MILFFQKMILYSVSRASTAYQTRPRASLLQISSCILHHFASLFSIITANPPRVGISQRIEYPPSIELCIPINIFLCSSAFFSIILHDCYLGGKDEVCRQNIDPAALQYSMQRCRISNQTITQPFLIRLS